MKDRNGNDLTVGARVVLCGVIVRTQDGPKDAVVELEVATPDGRRENIEVAAGSLDARDPVDHHERAAAAAGAGGQQDNQEQQQEQAQAQAQQQQGEEHAEQAKEKGDKAEKKTAKVHHKAHNGHGHKKH
jgi:hypothetical protein